MQKTTALLGDASAELERCPLASGRAAEHVGEDGGDKDKRRHQEGDASFLSHRGEHQIGSLLAFTGELVQQRNDQTGERKKIKQKRMGSAQVCDILHGKIESCADCADKRADCTGDYAPAKKMQKNNAAALKAFPFAAQDNL